MNVNVINTIERIYLKNIQEFFLLIVKNEILEN